VYRLRYTVPYVYISLSVPAPVAPMISIKSVTAATSVLSDLDMEQLRQDSDKLLVAAPAIPAHDAQRKGRYRRHGDLFIGGPYPWPQYCTAARMKGVALVVWQLVHHQVRMTRKPEVTLPRNLLTAVGISRNAKARALRDLEKVGLIQVRCERGRAARITLVPLPNGSSASS